MLAEILAVTAMGFAVFGIGMLLIFLWSKLTGSAMLPGAWSRSHGNEAWVAQVSHPERALWERARNGAIMILLMGAWAAPVFLYQAHEQEKSLLGVIFATVWIVVLGLAGTIGGLTYHATEPLRARGRVWHLAANVTSILAYCAAAVVFAVIWALLATTFGFFPGI